MRLRVFLGMGLVAVLLVTSPGLVQPPGEKTFPDPININPPHFSKDPSVKLDYPIIYVRAPRKGDAVGTTWTEISQPVFMDPGADLMILYPDGKEDVLVAGGNGSVTDPMVSFDGEWVYYSYFHDLRGASPIRSAPAGADIYKIHVPSRKIVRLTHQEFTPNTGAADWAKDFRTPEAGKNHIEYGVFNMGPCPLPGGKIVFTSNRNAFRAPKRLPHTLQLFVMDEDGKNVDCIGHLNLGCALHPVVLKDGRIMFSSLESQGLRISTLWGLWTIHPDGTNWGPMVSAFMTGDSPAAYHFQTQLSDGSIVAEEYYNQTSNGFGGLVKFPVDVPKGRSAFGPGYTEDPRNPPLRQGRLDSGKARNRRLPFSPFGIESVTRFARVDEGPADFVALKSFAKNSPRVGKVTHPSGAPDNHLLLVWSNGPVNGGYTVHVPAVDGGLYLLKKGEGIDEPGQLLLIKNDPRYNEQWPRALVPYKRIYGIAEPAKLPSLANDGKLSPHLPPGTPFGLVGTSSLYKRESYPNGKVSGVTASHAGGFDRTGYQDLDPFNTAEVGVSLNWFNQGADAGRYSNSDIHAIRILAMEPTTDRQKGPKSQRTFVSHANERLRILGEIPVRKFIDGKQPSDPDGNPDTSFLAKIPADVGFTFQTIDKRGMVLNMSQTWHQLRPGEIRHDCGGCHAHSQQPTHFKDTYAARPDYAIFDLTQKTPLITAKASDQSGKQWDEKSQTGLRFDKGVKDVEYHRDVKPIFERSCVACHTQKWAKPAGNLVLDDYKMVSTPTTDDVPGSYYRLAMDAAGRFGHKPLLTGWKGPNASRYIRMFQSRRSLLIWKIHGERLDGWSNDDFPSETAPGAKTMALKGQPVADTLANRNRADLDYVGSAMPPREAIEGTYRGPDGQTIKVAPLSDEDKLTLVRWVDLGCPIDLDYEASAKTKGWMLDDQRPTLTLTHPRAGANPPLDRLLLGAYDYAGLDETSLQVVANIPINGVAAGQNLAKQFKSAAQGVWELRLAEPLSVAAGTLTVSVRDRQGNVTRIDRVFSAGK